MPVGFIIFFVIVLILVIAGFVFTFAMMFSPKFKSKLLGKQIEASKYIIDEHKNDIKSISDNVAEATKGATKTTARAIKEGFKDTIFCKHCGAEIEADSKFCKVCGKKL